MDATEMGNDSVHWGRVIELNNTAIEKATVVGCACRVQWQLVAHTIRSGKSHLKKQDEKGARPPTSRLGSGFNGGHGLSREI
jgi:hypothetical protein